VTEVLYSGAESLTYSGYIDLATGRTLACDPGGGTYNIAPINAGADVPNDGRFALVSPPEEDENESFPVTPEEETPDTAGEER
jgi:hypothetical protein